MDDNLRYSRRSSSILSSSSCSVRDNCCMTKPNPRKRQCPEEPSLPAEKASPPGSKRQQLSSSRPPAAFWDNLSKIWLTKPALKELDRRNNQSALSPPRPRFQRARRPVTRNFLGELTRNRPTPKSAIDFFRHCERNTLKDIKLFARRGGPGLSDLRGRPVPFEPLDHTMNSSQSSSRGRKRGSAPTESTPTKSARPAADTTVTKSSGVYDRNFQQNLVDGGVYPFGYRYPGAEIPAKPDNWQEINQRSAQPRPSLSPSKFSDSAFEEFVQADAGAAKEKQVSENVIPLIVGKVRDAKCLAGGVPFGNLDPLIDGTLLKPGNPDFYHGGRPEQLNRRVRTELSGRIVPSTQEDLPVAPNFFLAAKGPDGSLAVAGRQACYDGALGARAIHSLQSYGQSEPTYDNNAYSVTSIYHGGTLKMYTSHLVQPGGPGTRPENYMHQLGAYAMTNSKDSFREGAKAYRNLRDWTGEQRNAAIARANERAANADRVQPTVSASVSSTPEVSSPVTVTPLGRDSRSQSHESLTTQNDISYASETPHQESEASADELALDVNLPAKRSSRPKPSRRQKRNARGDRATSSRGIEQEILAQ